MEILGEGYRIAYNPSTATVTCDGSLRLLGSAGYTDIIEFFDGVAAQRPKKIIIELQNLKFLNSSGINALSKFVIKIREQKSSQIVVRGSKKFPWQSKSLINLQRLMPELQLDIEEE